MAFGPLFPITSWRERVFREGAIIRIIIRINTVYSKGPVR